MEPIAIIGIGCRFPKANGPSAFWRLLSEGIDAISEVPADRWDVDAYYDPDPSAPGKMTTRWGGFLDGIDQFDANFFRISPREAQRLDPQQRLLLEVTWEAFEDSGLVVDRLSGSRTGVFVGISSFDYGALQHSDIRLTDPHGGTGSALSIAANRLSYVFDLRGPSMAVDTACSSSLMALHLACQSLRSEECELAVAAGVNVIVSPTVTVTFSKAGFMAPNGRCKAFDAAADGYVRGEGAGVVVLKRLSRALSDGDPIHAVIRATATNQDGRTNGLTAPNRFSQEMVLTDAYRLAGFPPQRVGYVEAHGTGTALGDPIEAAALGAVIGSDRGRDRPCAIGSVKTNIGHLEAAAGIAAVIKTTLALEHGQIPPSLHFKEPNPHIPFDQLGLRVQTELGPWPGDCPPTAGVSGFGFGGTNVHVVLETAPERNGAAPVAARLAERAETVGSLAPSFLVPLSARSTGGLHAMTQAWKVRAQSSEAPLDLANAVYTASVRRVHHPHRLAAVVSDRHELAEQLTAALQAESRPGLSVARRPVARKRRIVFVFPGHGSQWPEMGRRLLEVEPVFASTLAACDQAMQPYLNWSVVDRLAGGELCGVAVVQPALFGLQVALAALWRSWGIEPHAVIGHSMGEVAAGYISGALSLHDAARVICQRSAVLSQASGQGVMTVVELPMAELQDLIDAQGSSVTIAANNGPETCVISGGVDAVDALVEHLQRDDVFCRKVNVDIASHGPQMDPLRPALLAALEDVRPRRPRLPFYSSVDGQPVAPVRLDAEYWIRNLRERVVFASAVGRALDDGYDVFVEISPHPTLVGALKQCFIHADKEAEALTSLRRGEDERTALLGSLGALYTLGCDLDWSALYPAGGRCVPLPPYPWQRERFWFDPPSPSANHSVGGHPLLHRGVEVSSHPGLHVWEVDLSSAAYLSEHVVDGAAILPAAAYLELVLAASGAGGIEAARFEQMYSLDSVDALQVTVAGDDCAIASGPPWERHATARARRSASPIRTAPDLHSLQQQCSEEIAVDAFYEQLLREGLQFGPGFRSIRAASRGTTGVLARVEAPREAGLRIHPILLDACLQVLGLALGTNSGSGVPVPVGLDALVLSDGPVSITEGWCFATSDNAAWLFDDTGHVVAGLSGLQLARISHSAGWVHDLRWVPTTPVPAPSVIRQESLLIVGDANGLAEALGNRLQSPVVCVASSRDVVDHLSTTDQVVFLADRGARSCADALQVVHALIANETVKPPRLWLVTRGAQALDGDRDVELDQAPVWGLGRTLAMEHPDLQPVLVDLPGSDAVQQAAALARELVADDGEDQVVYRGDRRFVARLVPSSVGSSTIALRDDRTYVISGGVGGLGLATAAWLVDAGARWIVLLSRSGPSPSAEAAIQEMQQRGATVLTVRADVTDKAQLAGALDTVRRTVPPIAGVLHAAGILDDRLIRTLDPDTLQQVMAPKTIGTRHLHELTQNDPIELFVLFSSMAATFGSPGQANYAAANAFLDAFAEHRARLGLPCLSIAWGPWARIGQAATPTRGGRLAARGLDSIEPEHALELLGRLLADGRTGRVAAGHVDVERWLEYVPLARARLLGVGVRDELRPVAPVRVREAILAMPAGIERMRVVLTHVRQHVGQVLRMGLSSLDDETPLRDMGFDSLLGLELQHRLEASFGIRLKTTLIFAHPTIAGIAGALTVLLTASTEAPVSPPPTGPLVSDELSEDDLVALLSKEIGLSRRGEPV